MFTLKTSMDSDKLKNPDFASANEDYFNEAAKMIDHPKATQWFGSFCNYILAVDHIHDGDLMAGTEGEALLERFFDWEFDPFWTQARAQLLPVCFSAYISWRMGTETGNRFAQNHIYFTIPCAVAFLLHGRKHVEERAAALQESLERLQSEDDK